MTQITDISVDGSGRYVRFSLRRPVEMFPSLPGMYTKLTIIDENVSQLCAVTGWSLHPRELHFIVKSDSEFGSLIANGLLGATVDVGDLCGGFDVTRVQCQRAICYAGGSGISAIVPLIDWVCSRGANTTLFYTETSQTHALRDVLCDLRTTYPQLDTRLITTDGVLSTNEHEPIIGMITKLADYSPINLLGGAMVRAKRPIIFACGPRNYVDRLRAAYVDSGLITSDQFMLNV